MGERCSEVDVHRPLLCLQATGSTVSSGMSFSLIACVELGLIVPNASL
jgi:hypothetical protein